MGIVTRMRLFSQLAPAPSLRRAPPRAVAAAFALAALALSAPACADADRMFTGRWVAHAPLDSAWLVGRPELAIGHFGPEVTGVAWFLDDDGIASRICPCTFLDPLTVDLDGRSFAATTTFCDGEVWIWRLTLDADADPQILEGSVEVAGDPTRAIAGVQLDLVDTFIPDEKKQCP